MEAVKWYQKAAEQGNAGAQNNLGFCYAEGNGVQQSWAEAVKWYQKAAEQGQARAQHSLGVCYAKGDGIPRNYSEAYFWLLLSSAQGDENTAKDLNIIEDSLTIEQQNMVQARAAEFKPRIS